MVRAHLHYTWHELMGALVGKIELETRWLYYIYNIIALPAWPCNKESSLLIFRVVLSFFFPPISCFSSQLLLLFCDNPLGCLFGHKIPYLQLLFFSSYYWVSIFYCLDFFSLFWILNICPRYNFILYLFHELEQDLCFDVPIQSTIYTSDI